MKNSNIQWIGNIPDNWEVSKVKYYFSHHKIIPGKRCNEYDRLALTLNGVILRDKNSSEGLQPKDFETYQLLQKGELVFKLIDLQNISTSRVGLAHNTGLVSPAYIIIHPNNIDVNYAEKFFLMMWHNEIFNSLGDEGVRSSLSSKDLLNFPILVPPLATQTLIATYLDAKCSEIDGLIADINKQIETLNELKKSTITEAVTKGLNKNAKLKDSGIQWIGMIPEGWSESRLGYESWIRARLGWKGLKAEEYVSEGHPFLSAFNIQNNHLSWSDLNFIDDRRYNESPEIMLKVGDIVLVKDGAGIGKCAKITDLPYRTATTNSSLGVITTDKDLHYNYLYYYFQSAIFQNIISRMLNGMGVPHLTQEVLNNIRIPVPPLAEQRDIAAYLDTKCTEFDSIISDKQKQISTLEAYKKSLIYEYVTGKKEVE